MEKQLFLHMGVQRTGTTSIQKAMAGSRGYLKKQGVLYPWLFGKPSHVKIAWDIFLEKTTAKDLVEAIKEKEDSRTHSVILSAEGFSFINNFSFIGELRKRYNVKVIMYLKEQLSWLESWYNQNIKWPWNSKLSGVSPEDFLGRMDDFYWIDYFSTLEKIERHVNRDDIHVEVVGAGGTRNTVDNFFSKTGINPSWLNSYKEERNASLTKAQLDILRRIDIQPIQGPSRQKVLSALRDMDIDEDDGSKTVFDPEQSMKIHERFRESNRRVAERYFGRRELFPGKPLKYRAPVNISEDKVYRQYLPEVVRRVADM